MRYDIANDGPGLGIWGEVHDRFAAEDAARRAWLERQIAAEEAAKRTPLAPLPIPGCPPCCGCEKCRAQRKERQRIYRQRHRAKVAAAGKLGEELAQKREARRRRQARGSRW